MIVKAINDTVDSEELMLILLIFETYIRMHVMNLSTPSIIQRAMTIKKAMIEIRKFRAECQIVDVLNIRKDSIVTSIHDLSLNSDVLIWRDNLNQRDKWIELFKLLDIEDETCKIVLSFESTDFWSIVIKSFLIESIIESINNVESIDENFQSIAENVQSFDHQNKFLDVSFSIIKFILIKRLSLLYQYFVDIFVFLLNEDSHSN